jgi:hypothetical protein
MKQGNQGRTQDLQAFKALTATLPATKIGAVVALFPEIRHLQRQGHKTRAIWESLRRDGIEMSYELFRVYLGRARRRLERNAPRTSTATDLDQTPTRTTDSPSLQEARLASDRPAIDPFAAIRQSRGQKVKERFEYDPLTPLKEDLLR